MKFVIQHLQIGYTLLLTHKPVVKTMAIVQQVICRHDRYHKQYQQDDSYSLIGLRLLHGATILTKRYVGRHLLKQLCIDTIVVAIKLPLVQCQCCNSTLVADIKNDMIVGLDTIVIPLNLWCHQ